MVMRGMPDRSIDLSVEGGGSHLLCLLPQRLQWNARKRAVTSERELTAGQTVRALIDDAANRMWISGMSHPVEDHLSYRALAIDPLGRSFVIDRLR